jgi:nicotinate phosphoribosyltransferase
MLRELELSCDVAAVPEGTVVFPHEPLVRVTGPLLQAQLVETMLLNVLGFQSLVATKAARICHAARPDPVLEFGLRRAQGINGALAASRAAYVGGCTATSNVLAGKLYGIPVRGTHAHSWVMAFADELESFNAYASAMPNNCVLLVDTYDTRTGVLHAIEVGRRLRQRGHELAGIRLDSGDLAALSIDARRRLDEAGLVDTAIVASNDLDEHAIAELKQRGARINVWGVGTRLVTAHDQPALGVVYKLTAVRESGRSWQYRLKLSEDPSKATNPGLLQVRRYRADAEFVGDAIFDAMLPPGQHCTIVDVRDPSRRQAIPATTEHEDLLVPVLQAGQTVYQSPSLAQVRARAADQLAALPDEVRRLHEPEWYPVGLEQSLHDLKTRLSADASRS